MSRIWALSFLPANCTWYASLKNLTSSRCGERQTIVKFAYRPIDSSIATFLHLVVDNVFVSLHPRKKMLDNLHCQIHLLNQAHNAPVCAQMPQWFQIGEQGNCVRECPSSYFRSLKILLTSLHASWPRLGPTAGCGESPLTRCWSEVHHPSQVRCEKLHCCNPCHAFIINKKSWALLEPNERRPLELDLFYVKWERSSRRKNAAKRTCLRNSVP